MNATAKPPPLPPPVVPLRCPRCNAFLFERRLANGSLVRVKCWRCGRLVTDGA